jgi:UDP-N-acetylglucosamine--N-acetylmuramyl-(pentapeptide) pyrophosphoryl-undecaprenol N-acetylglucosamine transferase
VHEQTSVAGLANRLVGRLAAKVALTFPEAGKHFPRDRVVVTGNPLRPELVGGSRERALDRFGLGGELPTLYVTGGAQGSHRINRTVGAILGELLEATQVIHQCGANPETRDLQWLQGEVGRVPAELQARYRVLPYVGAELRDVYAAADLVVSRAGAGTVNECCHLGRPAVFIPLPGTRGDEQTANARIVEAAGGAVILQETGLSPQRLIETVCSLLGDPPRLRLMGERARSLAAPDAADRITELIVATVFRGRGGSAAAAP